MHRNALIRRYLAVICMGIGFSVQRGSRFEGRSGWVRLHVMERHIEIFSSHAAAAAADREMWTTMTPQERLDRALELHARYREAFGEAGQGLARVARVVAFTRR